MMRFRKRFSGRKRTTALQIWMRWLAPRRGPSTPSTTLSPPTTPPKRQKSWWSSGRRSWQTTPNLEPLLLIPIWRRTIRMPRREASNWGRRKQPAWWKSRRKRCDVRRSTPQRCGISIGAWPRASNCRLLPPQVLPCMPPATPAPWRRWRHNGRLARLDPGHNRRRAKPRAAAGSRARKAV